MKKELSVLIPVYNKKCGMLINELSRQLSSIDNLKYEILIIDDGSTDRSIIDENTIELNKVEHCKYIVQEENRGRAATRNLLGKHAQNQWLLFLDSGVVIDNLHFIKSYLNTEPEYEVVYGGIKTNEKNVAGNLRYLYERKYELKHSALQRSQRPYQAFRTTNFMIRKDVFCRILLNQKITTYGYEDVLFGKSLYDNNVKILHIDNAVRYMEYDNNVTFMRKTEEALHTLYSLKDSLRDYSRIIRINDLLTSLHLKNLFWSIFNYKRNEWRDNLTSDNPSLFLFNLYRIGYFISISKHP